MSLDPTLTAVATSLIGLLLAGNAFFIKKLVDKIETASDGTVRTNAGMEKLSRDMASFSGQLYEVRSDIKDLRKIELDVAVLKAHYHQKSERVHA